MRPTGVYFAVLILAAAPARAGDFAGRVVGVTDGDTLTVLTAGKVPVKVRLWGVDAPESGQGGVRRWPRGP